MNNGFEQIREWAAGLVWLLVLLVLLDIVGLNLPHFAGSQPRLWGRVIKSWGE